MAARILQGEHMSLPDIPLMQEIIECCKKHGNRIFLDDAKTKKQSTFGQLLENAGAISSRIRNLGQGPEKVVIIVSDSTVEALTTNFGIWLSGAATSPINPNLPIEEILYFFKICCSEVVYCGEDYLEKVKEAVSRLDWNVTIICPNRQDGVLDYYRCLEEGNSAEGILLEGWWTGKDHALSILFTSGTTGSPKGVVVRDEALSYNRHLDVWKETCTDSSTLLLTTPMYWISNTWISVITSCTGKKLVIATRMSVEQMMETITEYKPTEWFTGPAILIDICKDVNANKYDFSSLKTISLGGSIILPEHRKLISEKMTGNKHIVKTMYGSTETSLVTFERTIPDLDSPKLSSIGKVANSVTIKIVDTETGKIQPPYAIGEICIKSAGLLKRYINKEFTEEDMDKDGFWHLGDLGYYDDEEYLYYSSRLKDVMKYKGQQIAPAELESILQKHPDVIECCVVGKTCIEQGGELPAAFIIKRLGSNLSEEDLHSYISDKVIDEKKLRGGIVFLDSIPKSPVGKVLRYELKKLL
ncbi:luciferin 4-monooxygenase [Halyomorpha halys]|uniref:luciferin 4-monooxygenase n=1 Tax=Halyomorpha halys TaxID=286706 RepID=UPI0006D4FA2A|nr:4-coumarate--CoA ligase 1 [Halyomorpha halys]